MGAGIAGVIVGGVLFFIIAWLCGRAADKNKRQALEYSERVQIELESFRQQQQQPSQREEEKAFREKEK